MKRAIGVGLCAAMVLVLWGCSDDDVVDPTELTPPSNLRVTDLAAGGGTVGLAWDGAVGEYVGYRIYAHTQSLQSLDKAETLAPYMRGEVGSAQQNATVSLTDSYTYYYVHVRAYTSDGDVSRASNELLVIARPEGANAVIYEFLSAVGNPSGYDLSTGEAVSMANTNPDRYERVDFFLAYSGGTSGGGDLYLWNPKAASSSYQNTAGFYGWTGTFDSLTRVPDGAAFSDHVAVSVGKVVVVQVTDENAITNYAKIEVVSVGGTSPNRTVTFRWAYQPAPGRPDLVPQP
ncbi:fibronectin type III domain-containing protein [Candidatus Fermentibacteria bacterium]|nr:fibronectin type III domain-containing protein [Candidatus Fermentibacteria bacterium]